MVKIARALAVVPLVLLATSAAADWGNDLKPGNGEKMIRDVQADLLQIVQAPPAEREERVASFLERGGKYTVEALKRFRNPELAPLFRALLNHSDWHIQHRGFLALEALGDPAAVLDRAWQALDHPERRIREKAAITCIVVWDGNPPPVDLDALIAGEHEFHVRRCLEALKARVAGTLHVERLSQEVVRTLDDGLVLAPFLRGMDTLAQAAPGVTPTPVTREGKAGSHGAPADRWTTPLMGYGEEEVPVSELQPFGNLSATGSVVHAGQDVGACMDGAGIYAPAAGVVRRIHTGDGRGTVLVVEHELPGGRLVHGVYLHAGATVFVQAGDPVECGQLLGTIGLGFSVENGGVLAHLHYGLYPGPYDPHHAYAARPASAGLADWYDPAEFLASWEERTRPVVPLLFAPSEALEGAARKANHGDFARAYDEALRLREHADRRSDAWANADEIVQAVRQAPRSGIRRAQALVDGGYPREALSLLEGLFSACKGMPDAEEIEKILDGWKDDDAFKLALKGQSKVEAAEKKALKERDPAKVVSMWEKLLEKYRGTCLEERIQQQLDRAQTGR